MLKIFVNNNAAVLFLVVITTIDASRILYLPLPKIRSSHHELKPSSLILRGLAKKPITNEFIPFSALERNMYEEQDENDEKRDVLDWEELVDVELAKHLLSADNNELDYLLSLDRATRKPSKLTRNHDSLDSASDNLSRRDQKQDASEPWASDTSISRTARLQLNGAVDNLERRKRRNDVLFLVIVGTSSLVGIVGLIAAAIFWYKIHKRAKATLDAEYPSYGITGPTSGGNKMSPSSTISDRKLAQSAQMFHYQQQRQQMMAQEKNELDAEPVHSDDSDDEAPGGGDYTVYECPGLAPTGEMEVRNPLFDEPDSSLTSSASASHPTTNNHYPQPIATASSSSSPPQEKSLS